MDTAISSADEADVTAMKTISRVQTAPPWPSRAIAAFGRTSPALTWASDIRFGYVGKTGLASRAKALNPIVVAQSQGMANQLRPPSM